MPKAIPIDKKFAEPSDVSRNTPGLQRDEWLENVAVGFRDNELVMNTILPEIAVRKDSAKYRVFSPKGWFKAAQKVGETALPEQQSLQYSFDTYSAEKYALEGWVSDDSITNAARDIDPLVDETEFLTQKILLTEEVLIIAEIISAIKAAGATYYTNLTAGTNWLSGASANILKDLSTGIKTIAKRIGKRPNVITMETDTYESMLTNSQIVEIVKHTSTAMITEGAPIKTLRGLRIMIADAVVNTGSQESPTYTKVLYDVDTVTALKNIIIMAFVQANNKLTFGKNFVPMRFTAFRGRALEGDRRTATLVHVRKKMAPKVTNVGAGYIIGSVLG